MSNAPRVGFVAESKKKGKGKIAGRGHDPDPFRKKRKKVFDNPVTPL
jgi:hypothetical protein